MKRLLPLLILSGIGLASPSALGQGPAKDKAVAQPAVVRTWGDLLDQPAIELRDGKKLRLGVEATSVPQKSGFLVYVLLEDTKWAWRGVGPVEVVLRRAKDEKGLEPLLPIAQAMNWTGKGKRLLFAGTQVVDQPGEYVLVFREGGKEIGRTPITVTIKDTQPFFPFAVSGNLLARALDRDEDLVHALQFQNRDRAVPVCDGSIPLLTDDPEIPRKQPLPRWAFEEPDAGLKLQANAHNLRLESKTDLMLGEPSLLVRLWVNDVPYHGTPKKERVLREIAKSTGGKQFRIDWNFDPDMVKARKGDRIGVQLLYCPEGWQNFNPRVNLEGRARRKEDVSARLPMLSNKAEFVVGSEPAVVRTWDELLEQKPILLADGKNVRLGLETKKLPSRNAFLVYALVEDSRAGRRGDDYLGPLKVEISRIRRPGELARLEQEKAREALPKFAADLDQGKHLLFAKSLTVDRPGDYLVTFRNERDFVVASATITAAEEQSHSWLPFGEPAEARLDKVTKEGLQVHWLHQNRLAAVPLCDGNRPLLSDRRAIPPMQPLPSWVFEKPDASVHLTADHRSLRLESKNELSLSPEQFLFRLWVNDKPYALPKQKDNIDAQIIFGDGMPGKKLVIDWAFDAKILQAKKGDRIAVQLLYCPDYWKEFQPEGEPMAGRPQRVQKKREEPSERILGKGEFIVIPDLPVLTNKAEFVVP